MADHARLSPSSADRWMTCPGSVPLSVGIENRSSAFAEEGTLAHSVAEQMILTGFCEGKVSVDMMEHVMVYVDHVNELHDHLQAKLLIEQKVQVTPDTWGTADAIVWRPDESTLYVRDLKYGQGVPVEVEDNAQLKMYALGALLTVGYPAERVDIGIVQPRCPHSDGPIRTVSFDVVDLFDFYADVLKAQERVRVAAIAPAARRDVTWEDYHLKLSEKGCRWCPAAAMCPLQRRKAQHMAKQVFAPGLAYEPKALADTLEWLPIGEAWIKNVREFAYAEAEKGRDIPDHKLVEKRATRKWRDVNGVHNALMNAGILVTSEFKTEPEIKSVAEIEKLIPKEQRPLLNALVIKQSSGHTLVHESDPRPAIKVDAKSAFTGV